MSKRRSRRVTVFIAVALLFFFAYPCLADETELLSIQDFPIAANQFVDGFEVHSWGVHVWAVCKLPTPAWKITGGTDGSPEGILSGEAGIISAAGLPKSELARLKDLFLIDVTEYQPYPRGDPKREYQPATFAGWVRVGTYGTDFPGHKIRLAPRNFVRVPARQCPVPPDLAG